MNIVPVARLFEVFDLKDGCLFRKVRAGKVLAGDRAGTVQGGGYRIVMVDNIRMKEHRVIWAMTHGAWPSENQVVDHIDGQPANNLPENLRVISQRENCQNRRKVRCTSTVGSRVPGVIRNKNGSYSVKLHIDGRQTHLGRFCSLEAAEGKAVEMRRLHYGANTL